MSFSFLGVPPPNSPDECGTLTKKIIRTCLLRANILQGGSGNTINITNLIDIVNNFLNRCANYPLQIDASANQCIEIAPGFCGSVLQNINNAWGIYRSPGITEITVGAGGDGVAPGCNFPNVAAAIGAPNTPTDCHFIRITDNTTDGALVLPANTLIYVDPGVNWTVTGQITISGDFVLWGANPTPSSRITYNSLGAAVPLIIGAGSLLIQNMHISHTAGNSQPVVHPTIPTRMKHVVAEVGATTASFISDGLAPFTNMTLDHVTINGAGTNRPMVAGNVASVFRANELEFTGVINTAMQAAVATHEWNGIRNRATPVAPATTIGFTIGGTISDFQDITQTASLSLGPDVQITNMTFNTILIGGGANLLHINNATGLLISFGLFPNNVVFNNVTTNALAGNAFDLGANCQVNNFRVLTPVPIITSSFTASPQLSNIVLPATWNIRGDIMGVLTNQTIYLSNINVTGDFSFNTGFAGTEPTTTCQISNMQCTNFTFGVAATDAGTLIGSNLRILGNCAIFVGRDILGIEPNGSVIMNNFWITGTYTHTQSTMGAYSNGLVTGNATWVGPPGINSPTRQKWNCVEFTGVDITINSDNNSFTNIMALNAGTTAPRNLTINGNDNIIHGLNTWRLSQFPSQAGVVTIAGQNNVCTSWFMNGGNFIVTGPANTFTGLRISGNQAVVGATPQVFHIFGSQCKLSNIYLGAVVVANVINFTIDGFGSFVDGSYNVNLGDPAGGTSGLQVENFSLYPKRGQTRVVGLGDIFGAPNPANMFTRFNAFASSFNNIRIWFYPGGGAIPAGVLIPSAVSLVTVTGTCSQCQFQNMIIGFAQDTPGATAGLSLGTLLVTGAGTDNSFQNITAVNYSVDQANANFLGVNGYTFAQVASPPQFFSTGAGTTLSQASFPALASNITLSGVNVSLCNSTVGGGPAGVPVFGLTMPVTADRAIVNGNQFISGPTSISIAPLIPFPPLFVGNANSGGPIPVNANGASTGNY